MSDSAFPAGAFPSCTLKELKHSLSNMKRQPAANPYTMLRMETEIERREAVEAGDYSNSTPGERLRAVRENDRLSFVQVDGKWQKVIK